MAAKRRALLGDLPDAARAKVLREPPHVQTDWTCLIGGLAAKLRSMSARSTRVAASRIETTWMGLTARPKTIEDPPDVPGAEDVDPGRDIRGSPQDGQGQRA